MFLKSFNDYKNDDHPYLNRRAKLRENGFFFNKDDISNFTYEDTLNIKKQNCFFNYKKLNGNLGEKLQINLEDLQEGQMKILDDFKILNFQVFKENNHIKIFSINMSS